MKFHKLLIALLVLSLTLGVNLSVFAQDEETEEPEMDEEQWQQQMDEYTAKKNELTAKLDQLNKDVDALKKTNADKDAAVLKAEEDMYASVGTTKTTVAEFRSQFELLEKECKSKKITKEEADKKYALITIKKTYCLPEFYQRYKDLGKCIEGLVPPPPAGYTVVKGDCLHKIAGKKEVYNNVKMWPVLWEANEKAVVSAPPKVPTAVKNPNLIYPGQVLKVPALTEDLKKKAEEKSKKYRYHRKPKVEKTEGDVKKDVKKDEKKDVKKDEKKDVKKDVKKEEPKKETPKK
jgi:outer membrane murein-binding lipoprotein Lpp